MNMERIQIAQQTKELIDEMLETLDFTCDDEMERKAEEQKATEQKAEEEKIEKQKVVEQNAKEQNAEEQKGKEQKVAELWEAEQWAAEQWAAEQWAEEQWSEEQNTAAFLEDTAEKLQIANGEAAAMAPQENNEENDTDNPIVSELRKILNQLPAWEREELVPSNRRLSDPVWSQTPSTLCEDANDEEWNIMLELNRLRNRSLFEQQLDSAIFGNTTDGPLSNIPDDYFEPPESYATLSKPSPNLLENIPPLINENNIGDSSINPFPEPDTYMGNFRNELHPTPPYAPEIAGSVVDFALLGKRSGNGRVSTSAATAAYYQMCNSLPRQAASNLVYSILLSRAAMAPGANVLPPFAYNQQPPPMNLLPNRLANVALVSSPVIFYFNPTITPPSLQYLNSFIGDPQFLNGGGSGQGLGVGNNVSMYERLMYAQMLQQQLYHQTQQHAAAMASISQQYKAPFPTFLRASNSGVQVNGGNNGSCDAGYN